MPMGDVGLSSSVPVCTVRMDVEPPPQVGEFERIVMTDLGATVTVPPRTKTPRWTGR